MNKILIISLLLLLSVTGIFAGNIEKWPLGTSLNIAAGYGQDVFDAAKAAGIRYTEVFVGGSVGDTKEEIHKTFREFGEKTRKAGMEVWSFHIPFGWNYDLSEPDSVKRKKCRENIICYLEYASHLGKYEKAVLHTGFEPIKPEERQIRLAALKQALKEFGPFVKKEFGVQLVIECLPRTCLGNGSAEILSLIEENPDVDVCFDTNHLLGEDSADFAKNVGKRIATLHVSDYDKINERHWMPGKGVIDFTQLVTNLEKSGYKGPFLFEVNESPYRENNDMKGYFAALADCWKKIVADYNTATVFRTKPYLQNPVNNGITVTWLSNVPVYSWVEYGTDTANLQRAHTLVDGQVVSNNHIHKIRLNNLQPGMPYYYRACSKEITYYGAYKKEFGAMAKTGFSVFTLPKENASDFTAIIFNDVHKKYPTFDSLCRQIKDIPYDFAMFNGDCIDDPANEEQAVRAISYYNDKIGADKVPVFYLRGNHEIRNAYSIGMRELFDYVGDKTYSAFSWGDTRFVQLDCGEDKPDHSPVYYGLNDFSQLLKDQVGFLKKELASREFKKASKRVVVHHIPLFGKEKEPYLPGYELWGGLLSKAPFNVSINGHMHKFEYVPRGADKNNYPVIIGGGYSMDNATVIILKKKGDVLIVSVLDARGKELFHQEL